MNRRNFMKDGLAAFSAAQLLPGMQLLPALSAAQSERPVPPTNWADPKLNATASASSYVDDPPAGYLPSNVFGTNNYSGWESKEEAAGAWIEIDFHELRAVKEIWILAEPQPHEVLGQDVYMMTYSRAQLLQPPRKLRIGFSTGTSYPVEIRQAEYFQIIQLPSPEMTSSVRLTVEEVFAKPSGKETGIGKIRIFSESHKPSFDIATHKMYDVHDGKPVQTATLNLINPGEQVAGAELQVSQDGKPVMTFPLKAVPARASVEQYVWIPAPFEDSEMTFQIAKAGQFCCEQALQVPKYHSYFDGGTFQINCTNHNDLGWLNTQEKTADYRSSDLIVPALKLLREYPEFFYTMECTAYLMEFLQRHPELRDEMAKFMRERRFIWGASYVELLEISVGPEKLVRQFYFGRRWLKKTFPGVDTHFYVQTDPPQMSLQMPQILARAGVKYCLLGRLPFGFYHWKSPDDSSVLTFGYRYVDPNTLLNTRDNLGWLHFADEREPYYSSHHLPRNFIFDYTSDYLPPEPNLPPYVHHENKTMAAFAVAWNTHFSGQPSCQIHPPKILFTTPEKYLDELTSGPINIETLRGDWPFAWAYYDEPSNREALLHGRLAHNSLLAAEQIYVALQLSGQAPEYPAADFEAAWKANIWPDHGWGGNRGTVTDQVYAESYAKSKMMADQLLSAAGAKIATAIPKTSGTNNRIPIAVYNPLSWQRTDLVECEFKAPGSWPGWTLLDEDGKEIPVEFLGSANQSTKMSFVAHDIPPCGYHSYYLASSAAQPAQSSGVKDTNIVENQFFRVEFGIGGIKSLFDKQRNWEVLQTGKFQGGEVLQFTAPGVAWEGPELVEMNDFDKTSNHDFPFVSFSKTPVRTTAVREAKFEHFTLREFFHLYESLDRLDIEIEILNWDGTKERELRVAFPINLQTARLSYEVPFGSVEIGKDELDFSQLPTNMDTQFAPLIYGGAHPVAFREAINWIDASSPDFSRVGCLAASDITLHIFKDETTDPVPYPVLQHVLLSGRKSLAWNPEYWYTQKGDHRYRMALFPHSDNWRTRYREGIGFNHRLLAFVGQEEATPETRSPDSLAFMTLEPHNLILTAMKKSEDGDRVVARFYEAEGDQSVAQIRLAKPIRRAWKTNLIEDPEDALHLNANGSLQLPVRPYEIVTVMLEV